MVVDGCAVQERVKGSLTTCFCGDYHPTEASTFFFLSFFLFWYFETGFLCVSLAVLKLTL